MAVLRSILKIQLLSEPNAPALGRARFNSSMYYSDIAAVHMIMRYVNFVLHSYTVLHLHIADFRTLFHRGVKNRREKVYNV